ncbi:MAG TPA: ATP synthase F0 subunit B [Candidatus Woesebacteria bacterium]|nr:ATP synthase F0 subunit B [Candidatus Woesebacteria bacterium]HNS65774.1 ATP synthase F0 subunit B [Candidatus Woesebacteria bacterium]
MDILIPQIIFQVINFLVVLGLLTYLLYKPILQIFKERSERIEKGQKAAQEAINQQEKLVEYEEKKQRELEKKIATKLEKASKEAEEHKARLMEKAKVDVDDFIDKQHKKTEQEKAQVLAKMQEGLADAVVLATEKILAKKLTKQEKDTLVTQQLEEALQGM